MRIGKRTISAWLGKGTRSSQGNSQYVTEKLNMLTEMGFIAVGGTSWERNSTVFCCLGQFQPLVKGDRNVGVARARAGLLHRPGTAGPN